MEFSTYTAYIGSSLGSLGDINGSTILVEGDNDDVTPSGSSLLSKINLVMCAVGIAGAAGNVFVIVVILGSTSMRKRSTNILILLQSIIDLINSILVILNNTIKDQINGVPSGLGSEIFCRMWLMRSN